MLYPAMSELLKHVDSRYLLVNVVAHRARQISIESELTHEPLPEKPVILSFDDGYYNNYYYAFPLLEEYDAKIVISPI